MVLLTLKERGDALLARCKRSLAARGLKQAGYASADIVAMAFANGLPFDESDHETWEECVKQGQYERKTR